MEAGAEKELRDCRGRSCMHLASENGHPASVSILADKGAEINARDDAGHTPLLLAVATVSRLLLEHADVDAGAGACDDLRHPPCEASRPFDRSAGGREGGELGRRMEVVWSEEDGKGGKKS
eukprot:767728-Hanusia_phi.AAC.1